MMSSLIHNVIGQMHSQAQKISAPDEFLSNGKLTSLGSGPNFSDALFNSINEINKSQQTAKAQSQSWMSGNSDIGLNDVMLSLQKSSVAFSFGVQLRNKMLSAYQEVMNMPA
ncbi:Flagellar hook-basal body complex protein FliE [Erwinia amylovora Ea644]|nr:Flagellar hook-basal body complex protein FliE [Erwinia amylovora Ea644]CCP08075.1 Flagellar hook-basal body complex protein FliE [Erwinia amylovora MR1]